MRRVGLVVVLLVALLVGSPAGTAATDGCRPSQGVVLIHGGGDSLHFQPSAVDGDGSLHSLSLLGHEGMPPLVSAWSTCGDGAWAVTPEGHVYIGGDAGHFGDVKDRALNAPIVGMAVSPSGRGYWLVAEDGGIFAFGDAPYLGSTGAMRLNQPIVAMAATPSGHGYWLAAADGGMFTFGDATFLGSTGDRALNEPIVGMVPTTSGRGYWLVAEDGGIFTFGDARFHGSTAGTSTAPVVGMMPNGVGYTIVDRVGTVTVLPAGTTTAGDDHDHGDGDSGTTTDTPTGTGPIISLDDPRLTEAQRARAQSLIDRTAEAMAAFPDERSLIRAGYKSIGDAATGFEHYVNWALLADSKELNPDAIESIVLQVDGGQKTVASAMYILSIGDTMDDVPDIAGELTTWHNHTDLCFEGTEVVDLVGDDGCSRGVNVVTPPMLHVWIVDNPCGPFAGIETGGHGDACLHVDHVG